jgi:hypothetical protein
MVEYLLKIEFFAMAEIRIGCDKLPEAVSPGGTEYAQFKKEAGECPGRSRFYYPE